MAITKDKKQQIVSDVQELLGSSKMTVYARYAGVTVRQLQELRTAAEENGTTLRVVKNRLVRVAAKNNDNLKDVDFSSLQGQLLYAFNADDEVAAAQTLAGFSKKYSSLEFAGAVSHEGLLLSEAEVKQLAALPSKDQLRGQLVGTIAAPLSGFMNVMSGNIRGLMNVLNARSESLQ